MSVSAGITSRKKKVGDMNIRRISLGLIISAGISFNLVGCGELRPSNQSIVEHDKYRHGASIKKHNQHHHGSGAKQHSDD